MLRWNSLSERNQVEKHRGAGGVAWLIDRVPCPAGSLPQHGIYQTWWCMPVILALRGETRKIRGSMSPRATGDMKGKINIQAAFQTTIAQSSKYRSRRRPWPVHSKAAKTKESPEDNGRVAFHRSHCCFVGVGEGETIRDGILRYRFQSSPF